MNQRLMNQGRGLGFFLSLMNAGKMFLLLFLYNMEISSLELLAARLLQTFTFQNYQIIMILRNKSKLHYSMQCMKILKCLVFLNQLQKVNKEMVDGGMRLGKKQKEVGLLANLIFVQCFFPTLWELKYILQGLG